MKSPKLFHLWVLLSLLAAVASTPLRQAEAACDQARTLAEFDGDVSIEMEDGGVADDVDVATPGDRVHPVEFEVLLESWQPSSLTFWDFQRDALVVSPIDRPPRIVESSRTRLARIPRFLI